MVWKFMTYTIWKNRTKKNDKNKDDHLKMLHPQADTKGVQKIKDVLLCDWKESRNKRGKGAGEECNYETEDL